VTPGEVAKFIADQEADGQKGWTVDGYLTPLSGVFAHAARHLGFNGPNPVMLLDRTERPRKDDARPKRILTPAELDALLTAVDAPYRLLFALTAETGGRKSEVLGLTWADVDTEARTVRFAKQLSRGRERVDLKTGRSRRTLEVTGDLSAQLAAERLSRYPGASGPDDLVFVSRRGTPHDHRNMDRVLARAVKKAKLPAPAPTMHDLRHTHASRLIAAGMDVQSVADRLGHADIAITQRTYVHEFDAAGRSDARRAMIESLYGKEAVPEAALSA
jgi:integrase